MSLVRNAVEKLGGARGVCSRLGIPYSHDFKCPWRDDRGKKMRWNDARSGKERWYDFKAAEGGDEVDFVAKVLGVSNREACKVIIEWAGLDHRKKMNGVRDKKPVVRPRPRPATPGKRVKPVCPALRRAEPGEVDVIAEQRGLPWQAIENLGDRGVIGIGKKWGVACWFFRDSTGWNIRARRLDGGLFQGVKAVTLKGAWAAWPIGLDRVSGVHSLLLVEGEGDGLAAWSAIWACDAWDEWAVCVMAGASMSIPTECLPLFAGKFVRIVPHIGDKSRAGELGAVRWAEQLQAAGAEVDVYMLPGGDLGDLLEGKNKDEIREFGLTENK